MSHRPNRQAVPTGAPGTRNSPERVNAHRVKMTGKFFRNQERSRTGFFRTAKKGK